MTTCMKKANNFEIAKFQLKGVNFQPGVAYKSVAYRKIFNVAMFAYCECALNTEITSVLAI